MLPTLSRASLGKTCLSLHHPRRAAYAVPRFSRPVRGESRTSSGQVTRHPCSSGMAVVIPARRDIAMSAVVTLGAHGLRHRCRMSACPIGHSAPQQRRPNPPAAYVDPLPLPPSREGFALLTCQRAFCCQRLPPHASAEVASVIHGLVRWSRAEPTFSLASSDDSISTRSARSKLVPPED